MKFAIPLFFLLSGCTLSGSATVDPSIECTNGCETDESECLTVCKQACADAGGDDTDEACDEDCDTTCTEEYEECTFSCTSAD